jgi:formate hydrogenlyase subunit 4
MATLIGTAALLVQLALMLALAPVLVGVLRRIEARLTGRVGPPVAQPWRDLLRLARKQPVVAENASWLFRAAPAGAFAATLAAAALVPAFALGMVDAPLADMVVLVGLLAVARCFMALAGFDAGTAFGGIGATRAMTIGCFAEPAMLMVVFTLGLLAGSTNLDTIVAVLRDGAGLRASFGLALVAIVAVALSQVGRLPVGGPASRLELALAEPATALEYSGWQLALIEWTAALRLLLWLTLIGTIFAPVGLATPGSGVLAWLLALPAWGLKLVVLATALAAFESTTAGMRFARVPEFLGIALLLGLLAAVLLFASQAIT